MITAPYNFVPLNKEVFYPDWAAEVSHDIPFTDGESGEIEITVFAETPIFIRNHYQEGDDYYEDKQGNKISKEFCHVKTRDGAKQFYIPGSSIKGMIRSVVEIISFSKIRVDEKSLKKPLSVRDMTPNSPRNPKFNHPMVATAQKCGFLVKDGDNYFIEDCGTPLTISYNEIEQATGEYIKKYESAQEKYEKVGIVNLPVKKEKKSMDVRGKKISKNIALYSPQASQKGQLVCTGSIDNKKNEFIFITNGNKKPITKKIYNDFKNVYFEDEESLDGQYWKKLWKNGDGKKIPVFYIEENNQISAIGLTQIFKLAYKKTLYDAIKQEIDDTKLDLSETIFGTEKENLALKGRVQFSHLKSSNIKFEKEKSEILGSPKPSYYPNYIRQKNVDGDMVKKYITLMDDAAEISGYKRYPLHKTIKKSHIPDEEKTDIQTVFKPLDKGSTFKGKIRFHNLKKSEIGALLSALTFHGNSDTHRHSLGMAKSLGYGKIKIELSTKSLIYSQNDYLAEFEKEMTIFQSDWVISPQLRELFAMANINIKSDENLIYQKLENPNTRDRETNDFARAKKNKHYLKSYSQLDNIVPVTPKSAIDESDLEALRVKQAEREAQEQAKKEQQEREARERKQKEEAERVYKEALQSDNIQIVQNFLDKYPEHEKAGEIAKQLETLRQQQQENRHQKVNEQAKHAYEALQKNRSNLKKYTKDKEKFIKKWSADKNNKGSEYILKLVQKLREEK